MRRWLPVLARLPVQSSCTGALLSPVWKFVVAWLPVDFRHRCLFRPCTLKLARLLERSMHSCLSVPCSLEAIQFGDNPIASRDNVFQGCHAVWLPWPGMLTMSWESCHMRAGVQYSRGAARLPLPVV